MLFLAGEDSGNEVDPLYNCLMKYIDDRTKRLCENSFVPTVGLPFDRLDSILFDVTSRKTNI